MSAFKACVITLTPPQARTIGLITDGCIGNVIIEKDYLVGVGDVEITYAKAGELQGRIIHDDGRWGVTRGT